MSFASVFSRLAPAAMLLGAAACLPATLLAQDAGTQDNSFLSPLLGSTVFAVTTETLDIDGSITQFIPQGGDQGGLTITYNSGLTVANFALPLFGNTGRIVYTLVPETYLDPGAHAYKILAGGNFGRFTDTNNQIEPARNVARFDPITGTIDPTFVVGEGADDFVTSLVPLGNGETLVGGLFTHFDHLSYPRLALLGRTGYLDTNFQPVALTDGVFALAPETDPKTGKFDNNVLVGGTFSTIGSDNYTKLARVDLSGNVDSSFRPVIDSRVLAVATQPDGKVVIGGEFASVNGQTVGHLARLNRDGSLDPTFSASVGGLPAGTSAPVAVYVIKLLPDGRMYVGGQFDTVDGATRNYLARLEPNGSLDAGFDPGSAIINSVQAVAVQDDFRVLVGETVSRKDATSNFPPSLIRLYGGAVPDLEGVYLEVKLPDARTHADGTRDNGLFKVHRSGTDLSGPLTVYFQVTGTAQSGVAYKPLSASSLGQGIYRVTFAANQASVKVKVKPRPLDATDAPETFTLTLVSAPDGSSLYEAGELFDGSLVPSPTSGTVRIGNTN